VAETYLFGTQFIQLLAFHHLHRK